MTICSQVSWPNFNEKDRDFRVVALDDWLVSLISFISGAYSFWLSWILPKLYEYSKKLPTFKLTEPTNLAKTQSTQPLSIYLRESCPWFLRRTFSFPWLIRIISRAGFSVHKGQDDILRTKNSPRAWVPNTSPWLLCDHRKTRRRLSYQYLQIIGHLKKTFQRIFGCYRILSRLHGTYRRC